MGSVEKANNNEAASKYAPGPKHPNSQRQKMWRVENVPGTKWEKTSLKIKKESLTNSSNLCSFKSPSHPCRDQSLYMFDQCVGYLI